MWKENHSCNNYASYLSDGISPRNPSKPLTAPIRPFKLCTRPPFPSLVEPQDCVSRLWKDWWWSEMKIRLFVHLLILDLRPLMAPKTHHELQHVSDLVYLSVQYEMCLVYTVSATFVVIFMARSSTTNAVHCPLRSVELFEAIDWHVFNRNGWRLKQS